MSAYLFIYLLAIVQLAGSKRKKKKKKKGGIL